MLLLKSVFVIALFSVIVFNMYSAKAEEKKYVDLPKFYNFGTAEEREKVLTANFFKINEEVKQIVKKHW